MGRLIIYDTSNYTDFPIGGQLTSVRNFLHFMSDVHPDRMGDVFLIGVTTDPEAVGKLSRTGLFGKEVPFLPVCAAETDLAGTKHSLRLAFVKGLLKYGRLAHIRKDDCNYIQTPEAYGPARVLNPRTPCVIFSHGSYANMERGFRFFNDKKLVQKIFLRYIKWLLKKADLIFVLDSDSVRDYAPYTDRVIKVTNSIVVPDEEPERKGDKGTLLFVGRLSKDKGVDGIIRATRLLDGKRLVIVGDGEYREELEKTASGYEGIKLVGAVSPSEVPSYMADADMLVMNSAFEGLPMTILEAESAGLPVVTTDVGGIGDAVCFGRDAERTDGTPEGIARAVNKIYDDYEAYSAAAFENSRRFDYRVANAAVYEGLSGFWRN